jgi:hypothetical protein
VAASPYFDRTYFDETYFDTDPAPSAGGGGTGGRSKRRRAPLSVQRQPTPPADTEDWAVLIL